MRRDDELTVLILGWSSIAQRRVLPALLRLGHTQVDVASVTREVSLPTGLAGRVFADYADALRSSDAELVYVSTRNHEHANWASLVLESGRHVVVDKPAAVRSADVHRLVELAARVGRLVAEATVYSWHPQIATVERLMAQSEPITRLTATFLFPLLPPGNFRYDPSCGGGALWDLGPYAVTPGRVFFRAPPEEIVARAFVRDGDVVESAFSLVIRYPGDRVLVGHFGMPGAYVNRLELTGPDLTLTIERAFTTMADAPTRITGFRAGAPVVPVMPVMIDEPAADSFALFLADVVSAMSSGHHAPFAEAMLADTDALERLRAAAGRA